MYSLMSVWWFWTLLVLVFVLPVSYGWGFRGWGPPYPGYIQRRRMERAATAGSLGTFDHEAWGRGGDILWILVIFEVLIVAMIYWSR